MTELARELPALSVAQRTLEAFRKRASATRFAGSLVCLAIGAVYLVPLAWVLTEATKASSDVFSTSVWPHSFRITNYADAWHQFQLGTLFVHTVVITVGTVLLAIGLSVTAAYGFSRYRSRLGEGVFLLILTGLMVPPAAIIIPFFIAMRHLGLYDNLFAVIIGETAFGLPLGILLLRGYIDNIPLELTDAALVDGASEWKAFRHVVFPLLKPAVATVALFTTISAWNGFLLPLVLLRDTATSTLTVGIAQTAGEVGQLSLQLVAAASVLAVVPVLVVLIAARRYYVQGLSAGALKH
jgi:ABC-type glycerol-3-phosphate transport system permease component